jgi:hypothetical protein
MVGVGRENKWLILLIRTPPRKIRTEFQGYKHTSLTLFRGYSVSLSAAGHKVPQST